MYSQNPKSRASKGSVTLLVSNGRLQLRFSYGGKRHYLSLGLRSDDKRNWKIAERKAAIIEEECTVTNYLSRRQLNSHCTDMDVTGFEPVTSTMST